MTRGSRTRCTCRSPGIGSREARSTRRSRSSELRFSACFAQNVRKLHGRFDRFGGYVRNSFTGWRSCALQRLMSISARSSSRSRSAARSLLLKAIDLHVGSIAHTELRRIKQFLAHAHGENATAGGHRIGGELDAVDHTFDLELLEASQLLRHSGRNVNDGQAGRSLGLEVAHLSSERPGTSHSNEIIAYREPQDRRRRPELTQVSTVWRRGRDSNSRWASDP